MRIIGPPSASVATVHTQLSTLIAHTRFAAEMVAPLWAAAEEYGVDPVGVVAQAFKETGGGSYSGKVRPEFHNTCGLKVTAAQQKLFPGVTDGDQPLAHAMFPSWVVGARAHVQHLRAYAGWPVPEFEVVDPRYSLVAGRHACESFQDLGGKWAPSSKYGAELVDIARKLQGATR